ncbi:MAG: rod shape-determining protein [Planctomycetes bacterium]|nr:rod shape-determining protein [Planctomycetota bacterium]
MTDQTKDSSPSKDHGVLYLGIDLGTSRTSVCASNGVRETVESFVGYPKDPVARKLLQKDVLFGQEAREKRLSLDLFRPLEHGVLTFNKEGKDDGSLRAAQDLVKEIVRQAKPRKDELVYAVIGVPAQASINNKDAILQAARESVDSVMLCSEPFSVAYGLDMLEDVLVIDIGAGTVDLCRMHGTMPEESDQITLTSGGDFVDDELAKELVAAYPEAQHTKQMVKAIKERHSTVDDNVERITVSLPVNGKPTELDITDCMKNACRRMIPPIVEGLGRLIATFDPEFQERLKNRVLLAGGGSQIRGLDSAIQAYMQETLGGGKVIRIEEPIYGGANGALKIAHDMPEEFWEKLK